MKTIPFLIPIAAFGLSACEPAATDTTQKTEHGNGHMAETHIHLDSSAMNDMGLTYCTASWTEVKDSIRIRGMVHAPPQSIYDVSTPYGGRIVEMNFYEGAEVTKGQLLARISHVDFITLQETYLTLLAQERELKLALDRQTALYEKESTSEKAYQSALAAFHLTTAKLQGAKARLKLSQIDPQMVEEHGIQTEIALRAPVNGFITEAFGHIGKQMPPEAPVYRMIDQSHLHVELAVQQDKAQAVKTGQSVHFRAGDRQRLLRGEVFLVSKHVDPENRTVNVHVHPEDGIKGLMPGMFVQATLYTAGSHHWLLPPGSALQHEGEWYGLRQQGNQWDLVQFEARQVLADGSVMLDSKDPTPYICGRLQRALALLLEEEEGSRGHSH